STAPRLVKDDGAILMFDGARGYGRCVAGEAMAAAITRCRQTGVVAMTLANAHHVGRVGAYGELACAAGLVSLHFVNVADHRGLVAPFRGSDGRFSTNPVCIALPGTDRQPPLLLDMATSAVLIDPARLAGVDWLRREIDGFVEYVKASPPADPVAPVLVPGDPERLAREERARTGIPVDATTWEEILAAGEKLGLTRAEAEAL